MTTFSIRPRGAFSLRESVEFGFGQRHSAIFDGTMRLAFCVDGYAEQVGVAVRQDGAGDVHGVVHGDVQGEAAVRERVSREHGRVFDVAGSSVAAFPTPARLLELTEFRGVPDVKMKRLKAVAQAAADGALNAETIRACDPEEAVRGLREIPGIGEFAATLILIRASGVTDVPVDAEPRLAEIVGRLYRLPDAASSSDLHRTAEAWRPFRTWVAVLLRAASDRVPEELAVTADSA